jgi:hypothetical protein
MDQIAKKDTIPNEHICSVVKVNAGKRESVVT